MRPGKDASQQIAAAVEARDSHLAQIYFAAGRYAEALVLLEQLVACSTDPS